MKISEIAKIVDGKVIPSAFVDAEVTSACASDMMSDVLAFYAGNQGALVTGLMNPQVVRTAVMVDIGCIVFVRGKQPDEAMCNLAKDNDVVFVTTPLTLYETVGRLYAAGLDTSKA